MSQRLIDCFSDGPEGLVHCAFRYYLGRRTIAACCFARDLAKAWPLLTPRTAGMIRAELETAFERDDVGGACDRAAWETVRRAYSE